MNRQDYVDRIKQTLLEILSDIQTILAMDVPDVAERIMDDIGKMREIDRGERQAEKPAKAAERPAEVQEALDQCRTILNLSEEIPERGEDFASGVADTTRDMMTWIDLNNHVTEAQQEALDNMQSGLQRWLE